MRCLLGSLLLAAALLVASGSSRAQLLIPDSRELLASDAAALDELGASVSIDGDTAVVGAPHTAPLPDAPGAAYIYYRDQGGADQWGEVKVLTPSDGAVGDEFGFSVSIRGDTAIVGAIRIDAGLGAAYVFYRDQGGPDNWGEVKKLVPTGGPQNFGSSVASDGDTAIVGARVDEVGGAVGAGSAYVFYRDQGGVDNWGLVKKLLASDASSDDYFGSSVAIDADTALIGAQRHDGLGENTGSVYVFERDVGGVDNWGEVKRFIASDSSAGDLFGEGVSLLGNRALVGAAASDAAALNAGSAYIFERDEGGPDNWGQVAQMTATPVAEAAFFGSSVALDQDRALVGGRGAASAFLFRRDRGGTNNWGAQARLIASDSGAGDTFGAVSLSGDTVIAGSRFHDHLGGDSGSAYLWEVPLVSVPTLSGRWLVLLATALLGAAGWLVGRGARWRLA